MESEIGLVSKPLHRPISKQSPTFQFRRIDARRSFRRGSSNGAAILEKPVSDRGTLEDLSQSRHILIVARP